MRGHWGRGVQLLIVSSYLIVLVETTAVPALYIVDQ